jgi:hypothetical protein
VNEEEAAKWLQKAAAQQSSTPRMALTALGYSCGFQALVGAPTGADIFRIPLEATHTSRRGRSPP